MSTENPLEIPEIASIVASSLSSNDLANCLLVSKRWRALYLSHMWHSVQVDSKPARCGHFLVIGPHPADIYRYRHLIRRLTMIGDLAGLDKYNYPNLQHLVVDYTRCAKDPDRMIFLELTEMFPAVVSLDLKRVKIETATWLDLSTHSHITTLKLNGIDIKANVASEFWRACTKLEYLELRSVHIEGGAIPDDVMLIHLKRLVLWNMIGVDEVQQLRLIFQCPALKDFRWIIEWDDDDQIETGQVLTQAIPNERWPDLGRLEIIHRLNHTDIAAILNGIGNGHGCLTELTLDGCFLPNSSLELSIHFGTLVNLNIGYCFHVPSIVIRDILCSCPVLEVLVARCVRVQDIVNGEPWICNRLRELTICFKLEENEEELQREVFERLSRLVHLESLLMNCHDGQHTNSHVEFTLENGLQQLASLQRWKTLGFLGFIPQLTLNEVQWLNHHHKKLRIEGGPFNEDKDKNDKIMGMLVKLDIFI
ncbi:MAG: hypothetical protein J3Q66DRAFT_399041 [Benniella sp.]|nr:MAG: hypothetical protein J3Q66DRAFT_399041 [Benniella sp.]